jgi:NTP pyrophosphatase (non-canonical NTP hydrolase)
VSDTERHIREEVLDFAWEMELRLRDNDHKGRYRFESTSHLIAKLMEEVAELVDRLSEGDLDGILHEAADVGNLAMMSATYVGMILVPDDSCRAQPD